MNVILIPLRIKYDNFFTTNNNHKKINSLSKDKKSISPNKQNHIINAYISKLNACKKSNDSSKGNIVLSSNVKLGRNLNKNKLNPHNTHVSQPKTISQATSINKTKINNPDLTKFKHELKKLTLDKIFKFNENNYMTASLGLKKNHEILKLKTNLLNNKSLSPSKIQIETNRLLNKEKEKTKSCSREEIRADPISINLKEDNEKIKNIGLNEIVTNITKTNDNKSRNAQRNHITVTSSNPFSFDKAHTMQNVSYHKTDILYSQLHKKNITLMKHVNNLNTKPKPKTIPVVNKSFTSNLTVKLSKNHNNNNCLHNNTNTAKKKVNNITIWSVCENKKIQLKFATANATKINMNQNELTVKKNEKINTLGIKGNYLKPSKIFSK